MAVFSALDFTIAVNDVDMSDHLTSVDIPIEVDEHDTSNFGGDGWKENIGGLRGSQVALNFLQDFAASKVEATIWPLIGTHTNVVVRPLSDDVSVTNPQYTASVLVKDWKPVSAQVGNVVAAQVTWPASGPVVRATGT